MSVGGMLPDACDLEVRPGRRWATAEVAGGISTPQLMVAEPAQPRKFRERAFGGRALAASTHADFQPPAPARRPSLVQNRPNLVQRAPYVNSAEPHSQGKSPGRDNNRRRVAVQRRSTRIATEGPAQGSNSRRTDVRRPNRVEKSRRCWTTVSVIRDPRPDLLSRTVETVTCTAHEGAETEPECFVLNTPRR